MAEAVELDLLTSRDEITVAHMFNFLKFRCFEYMYVYPDPTTSVEIANTLRVPMQSVSKVLSRSYVHGHGYVRRLKKVPGSRFYRYALTKKGRRAYAAYLKRIKCGLSLNLHKKIPPHMANYTGKQEKDLYLKTREARTLTIQEFSAYIKIQKIKPKECDDLFA